MKTDSSILEKLVNEVANLKKIIADTVKPPDQVILDDVDLREQLKVSKRTTAYWREKGLITYSKLGGKIYYKLSDILEFIRNNETPAVNKSLRFKI